MMSHAPHIMKIITIFVCTLYDLNWLNYDVFKIWSTSLPSDVIDYTMSVQNVLHN